MNQEDIRPQRPLKTRSARGARSGVGIVLVLVALSVGGAALVKTLVKNKTHAIGREQEAVERQIAALRREIHAVEGDIDAALATKHLQTRLITGRTLLVEMDEVERKKIVHIPVLPVAKPTGKAQP